MTEPEQSPNRLEPLVRLFYEDDTVLGAFTEVTPEQMPEGYRQLLAHEHHMTVTVEEFHGSPVDVRVLDKVVTPEHYAREILLASQNDGSIVQYGIMRVHLADLPDNVGQEIVGEQTPLGRILIQHDVLRTIHLHRLWHVEPGPELRKHLVRSEPGITYGRTATIVCNGEPAIELLEIVAPLPVT